MKYKTKYDNEYYKYYGNYEHMGDTLDHSYTD